MTRHRRWWLPSAALAALLLASACSDSNNGAADAAVDVLARDTTPDTSPDLGASPCATDVTVVKVWGAGMALCDNTGFAPPTQCDAEAVLCNTATGWRLCTASQYAARMDNKGPGQQAWLQACVRDAEAAPAAPSDALCACQREIGTNPYDMAWSCTGVPLHKSVRQRHIGVITDKLCHRVGINDASTEGFWSTLTTESTRNAAMCCR